MRIVIKNGTIVDGSGSPRFKADLLIEDERITKIGEDLKIEDAEIINAEDKIVSPGFIDIHNHSDLSIFQSLQNEPYILQGVTTIVVGMCGLGVYPSNKNVEKYYFNYLDKAFFSAGTMFEDVRSLWDDLKEKGGFSPNMAFFIPHGNVRACVMGSKERKANQEELEKMKKIIMEHMEAGTFGMSTGLVYPPGSVTSTEELIELSKVIGEYDGIYDSHMRNEGAGVIDIGMNELIRIAREANVRAHISHWSVISKYAYKMTPKVINHLKEAKKSGLELTADVTVYDDGATSLSFILLSTWVFENFKENLNNKETRRKISTEIFEKLYSFFFADAPFYLKLIPKFILKKLIFKGLAKGTTILSVNHNREVEGMSVYKALTKLYPDKKLEESLLDFIRDEEGGILIRIKHKDEEKSVIPIFKQEFVCPSSDGFLEMEKNTHPRSYGAFARVLQRWVREMNVVSLEEAIRKMTSLPASILKLNKRGLLKPGYKADITIFNMEKIEEMGTIKDGKQHPLGIDYVIVNGAITARKGKHTGMRNGAILKHQK
ncbi:MAG: putative D-aminoacylase [Promethearchaeota archaeon]|nr:MAG: putative D-aminoacylase [Candidatus Lokiarchaeota archaeon]